VLYATALLPSGANAREAPDAAARFMNFRRVQWRLIVMDFYSASLAAT
jgi:hypothetical protein